MKRNLNHKLFFIILAVLISVPVIIPYFHKGYFPTHDGEWAVVRMADMFRSLRDQQFPVRYSGYLNFGYGYPLFNFAYPAPYYIGTLFHFAKIGFVNSVKALFVISVIISAISMFLLAFELLRSKTASIISVIFYIYLPYRIVDLYARGSIGESLSFALFPLILFFILKIFKKSKPFLYVALGAISYAGLIMTHNIMAVLFTPVMLIFIAYNYYQNKRESLRNILFFILLGFGLSAFFWLPALAEKQNILLSRIPIANRDSYFVTLEQLVIPKWGYGLPDHPDGFAYQIGLAHIGIIIVLISLLIYSRFMKKKISKNNSILIVTIFGIIIFVYILLMFSFTKYIWVNLPLLKEINYPWTLLAPLGLLISLLSGYLYSYNKLLKLIVLSLALFAIVYTLPHANPELYFDKGDDYYLTNDATTTSSQEYTPLWVKQKPFERSKNKIELIGGKGEVKNITLKSQLLSFDVLLPQISKVRINTIYYPGWKIIADGKEVQVNYDNVQGVMEFEVLEGKHHIAATFSETPLRLAGDILTLISFAGIILLAGSSYLKNNKFK